MTAESNLKLKTARTLKWNTVDKFASQVLYAVTGVVLANVLDKEDFGLVGVMLVFQSFASLFVDSGFSSALIQKKAPTERDYSTVLYFNVGMSLAFYVVLWLCAPLIARLFGDERLIALSRVMFLSFVINATAIVQTNRLMKQMTVARVAISNSIGLVVSGATGIWLALRGYGAWAIVWQTIVLAAVKSAVLWLTTGWVPRAAFSMESLRSVVKVGSSVMASSFLNTVSLNVCSFLIGIYYSLAQLGSYTQADKWSKMGIMSFSQILTSSFLPVLSGVQDEPERRVQVMRKMNRFTAYLLFPSMLLLITSATPIFHILFGTKWDEAILLFQILVGRGIFVVLTSLYNNYILSVGRARSLVVYEIVKDALLVAAIAVTIPLGVTAMIWGQFVSAAVFYVYSLYETSRQTGYKAHTMVGDLLPYLMLSALTVCLQWAVGATVGNAWASLAGQVAVCLTVYLGVNRLLGSKVQQDVLTYALGRFRHGRHRSDKARQNLP